MKKYISVAIRDKVESTGNDYNKGFRKCRAEELAQEIDVVCNDYDEKGYDLFSIVPIVQGQHIVFSSDGSWANSVTEGVIITFRAK
ncbi:MULTISPECIES: hypothetical protein [unclassified Acetobacterium]|jgi:hypothetical protein|uniref:hypothetical protein n=1 Tax=unclassified Acetobacterium TaxID=2638182 RepID=UPI000DBEB2E0|nr:MULTISPECIES: hypothetical protein [unclassified Acetobacterium]AWW27921.1 hypothetical protein DOZ58_15460 [Acetobacterium sp. KB-1]MDZ5726834.1 hypothetical protein [Acetobacterium sp. K1/6]